MTRKPEKDQVTGLSMENKTMSDKTMPMTNNKTELEEAINRVIDYQKWRRGDEELQQPHPVELGEDLDKLIKAAQDYIEDLREQLK